MAYVIKKGDNLTKIAKQNGLTLKQLLSLNKNIQNPDYIQIGQKINLPSQSPTGKPAYDNNDGYPINPPKKNTPTWDKTTKGAGNPNTVAIFNKTPQKVVTKQAIKKPIVKQEEPSFLDNLKENLNEKYNDILTAFDQQVTKKSETKQTNSKSILDDYVKEMIANGNKNILITDKGTKTTYYGKASDYKGNINNLHKMPVLTGVNDNPYDYKYNNTPNKIIEKLPKNQQDKAKVTPIGKFVLKKRNDLYGEPAFMFDGLDIAYHTIYPGELKKRTDSINDDSINNNNLTYGCINGKCGDIRELAKTFNTGDSSYVIDSRLPRKVLANIMHKKEYGGLAASDNIDMGYYTNPVKYFAAMGINISDDDCLECEDKVYANNKLNIDSTLNTNKNLNWVDRLYQKNTPTIFLPGESHPSTHYMENADNFVYPTIIQNEDGKLEYLGNKAYDYAMKTNTAIKFKTPEEAEYFAKNYKKGKGVLKKFNMGGKIKAEDGLNPKPLIPPKPEQIDFDMERQLPPDASYERDVRKFSWNNRDTAPEQIKLDSSYMLYKKPKGYSNVYNKGKLIGYTVDNKILIPGEPNFQNGGIVKAWIQKFSKGGYIADEGFPGGQELTQPTTNYYNWGNYGNQNSFLTPDQINQKPFQNNNSMQVPMAQSNMPQNIGTNYKTAYDASNDQVNKDNQLANSMMKSSSKGLSDPVSMGLDVGGKSLDATASLMSSLGKENSKAKAFGQGASGAMNVASQVTAPFKDIPIAGKAIDAVGKTLGFFIGGALEARRQGIENEEMDKYNKVQEYNSRNSVALYQPSNFGQYMSKYGSNIKNLEQRLIDDIFSDYDKYMQK